LTRDKALIALDEQYRDVLIETVAENLSTDI